MFGALWDRSHIKMYFSSSFCLVLCTSFEGGEGDGDTCKQTNEVPVAGIYTETQQRVVDVNQALQRRSGCRHKVPSFRLRFKTAYASLHKNIPVLVWVPCRCVTCQTLALFLATVPSSHFCSHCEMSLPFSLSLVFHIVIFQLVPLNSCHNRLLPPVSHSSPISHA